MLVLDEPESNLDFKNQLLVLDTMQSLARAGLTCVFNTHYPAHALRRANKALLLGRNGKSLFGSTQGVVTEQNISDYFGVRAVIGSIETPGRGVCGRDSRLGGTGTEGLPCMKFRASSPPCLRASRSGMKTGSA